MKGEVVNRMPQGDPSGDQAIADAYAAGWTVDRDNWWTRPLRTGDKSIGSSVVGFISLADMGRDGPAGVYVRTAAQALEYDTGVQL